MRRAGEIPEGALVVTPLTGKVGVVVFRDEGKHPGVVVDFGVSAGEKVLHPRVLLEVVELPR